MSFAGALARDRVRRLPLEAQLARVRDPAYWAALPAAEDPNAPDDEGVYERRDRDFDDGLGWTCAAVPAADLGPARAAIARVEAAGWPAVFALVTDELCALLRHAGLRGAIGAALGEDDFVQLPGIFVHRVEREPGARGWEPHVDVRGAAASEERGRLTAWLALSDAPLDGGCVYAVPRASTGALGDDWDTRARVEMHELLEAMHGARAVPVRAGGLVMWRRDCLHWGAPVERAHACPRLALSLEYARAAGPGERSFDPARPLEFEARLFLLGRALCAYGAEAREPEAARFVELGERLMR